MKNEFDSAFCNVKYIAESNITLITWKKFCSYDDYRNPVMFALKLLQEHALCNLVVDARNGFEDEKEDVEWAFSTLLPAMAKTDCKTLVMIMNQVSEIEGEMDMWTKEFSKYFAVKQVKSYDEAIQYLTSSMH